MVAALDSKSNLVRGLGSSPSEGTKFKGREMFKTVIKDTFNGNGSKVFETLGEAVEYGYTVGQPFQVYDFLDQSMILESTGKRMDAVTRFLQE